MLSANQRRKCAKCGHSSCKSSRSFHRIPKPSGGNIDRCRQWATWLYPEETWDEELKLQQLASKSRVVCGAHFAVEDFTDHARRILRRSAVPHVLLAPETQALAVSVQPPTSVTPPLTPCTSPMELGVSSALLAPAIPDTDQISDMSNTAAQVSEWATPVSSQRASTSPQNIATPRRVTFPDQCTPEAMTPSDLSINGLTPPQNASTSAAPLAQSSALPAKRQARRSILGPANVTRVAHLSPVKRVMHKSLSKAHKEIRRLRKKAETSPREILKDLNSSVCINRICSKAKMSQAAVTFFKAQIRQSSKKPKGRRWKIEDKLLALTIYKRSPSGYRFLRKLFALPCPSTLNNLLSSFPLRPGISDEVLASLKKSVESMKKGDNVCTVSFDEMSIKHHVAYNCKLDLIEGYEDHGEQGRSNKVASFACVFMVFGLRKFWKQPVAYYLSGSAMTGERLKILLVDVIRKLRSIGLKPMATICDMGTNNVKAMKNLRAQPYDCFFKVDDEEIIIIYDPPHLLKCIRNMFMKHNVECTVNVEVHDEAGENGQKLEGIAKWEHVQKLCELQKPMRLFRRAKKLTQAHIHPRFGQAMKVKLAAQVFSHSVAAAILSYNHKHDMGDTTATSSFLLEMDSLFDSVNGYSAHLQDGKFLRTRITEQSGHLKFWKDMKRKMRSWKFGKEDPPSKSGWIRTLNGMERLWKNLQEIGFKYLAPRRLNQDPLENLFGVLRALCGSNCKPNVPQFIGALKTAIINGVAAQDARNMNCEPDENEYLSNMRALLVKPADEPSDDEVKVDEEVEEVEETGNEHYEALCEQVKTDFKKRCKEMEVKMQNGDEDALGMAYVAGFIANRILTELDGKKVKCCCSKLLTSQGCEVFNGFIDLKEYDDKQRLTRPSYDLALTVANCADEVDKLLNESAHLSKVKSRVFAKLDELINFSWLDKCQVHFKSNVDTIKNSTFSIWLNWWLNRKNKSFGEDKQKVKVKMDKMTHK